MAFLNEKVQNRIILIVGAIAFLAHLLPGWFSWLSGAIPFIGGFSIPLIGALTYQKLVGVLGLVWVVKNAKRLWG